MKTKGFQGMKKRTAAEIFWKNKMNNEDDEEEARNVFFVNRRCTFVQEKGQIMIQEKNGTRRVATT